MTLHTLTVFGTRLGHSLAEKSVSDPDLGPIRLVKDLNRDAISHCTLRRVEHLRRSVMGRLRGLI